ncbi:MAG: hypothetical protein ACM3SW_14485 [Actinomycetota bacterium]
MTIFGFNTDVKIGETVYHVQSEARQADMLLQTMVFVKGQCVGKRVVSYAQKSVQPDFSEQAMHEFLKAQHKTVLEAIQEGRIETILGTEASIQDVGEGGLTLNWTNSVQTPDQADVSMCFQVTDAGKAVSGAAVSVSASVPADAQAVATATTDAQGKATVSFSLTQQMRQDASVMARASHGGKSATRKFRFKK